MMGKITFNPNSNRKGVVTMYQGNAVTFNTFRTTIAAVVYKTPLTAAGFIVW